MIKVLEDRIKLGKTQSFNEIFICKFLNFLRKISNLNWFLAQWRNNLTLDSLISFRINKTFQVYIDVVLIF